jgi:hypothetical protein
MGYLKGTKSAKKNDTGIFSDDEDVEASKDYNWESLYKYSKLMPVEMRYRYHEFNQKSLDFVCNSEYREKVKNLNNLPTAQMNYQKDLIRQRTARDPAGRGSKMYKDMLRGQVDVISPDGEIVREKAGTGNKAKLQ